jgi:FAD/FMN-containing dehydrogenase
VEKPEIIRRLIDIVGAEHVTDREFILLTYTRDFGIQPPRWPAIVVRPGSTEEIVQIVRLANEAGIPISPRGGGSAQEGGCQSEGGIVLETLRLDRILNVDEDAATVTVQAGITFVRLMAELERRGWKIGIAPSGAMAGTPGAHVSRPGVGWGNIKYVSQGDQVVSLTVVLPNGEVLRTGTAANPHARPFFRYGLGPDLAGLFIGAEGAFGIVTEVTLRMYPWPQQIYLERYVGASLYDAVDIFRQIAHHNLVCYISCPLIEPGRVLFDVNIEGDRPEVAHRLERIRAIVRSYPDIKFEGPDGPQQFWQNRWFLTGEEFQQGIAGAVNYFLPFDRLVEATSIMREIMLRRQIKRFAQQMFPEPTGSEHVNLLFHYPGDQEEYAKIRDAADEMMDKALELGGAPYSKGRQWAPHLERHLGQTGYWGALKALKRVLDPNHIMNPGVLGL